MILTEVINHGKMGSQHWIEDIRIQNEQSQLKILLAEMKWFVTLILTKNK